MSVLDHITPKAPQAEGLIWKQGTPPDPTLKVLLLIHCKSPISKYSLRIGSYSGGEYHPLGEEDYSPKEVAYWCLPPEKGPDGGVIL